MKKPGMNHQRQLWEQMVSNSRVISGLAPTRVDIDDHRLCGVKSQIFFKLLAYIGYSSTFITIL